MKTLLRFLVLLGLTGCAVPGTDDVAIEAPTGDAASALTLITLPPGVITPQPLLPGLTPKLPPIVLTPPPAWAPACSKTLNRFAVLTQTCAPLPAAGGVWSARPVFASDEGILCDMRWSPNKILSVAPPAYAALEAIAEREPLAIEYPRPASIHPLCDQTVICNPNVTSCAERTMVPPSTGPVAIGGMGGCSSCAFLAGDTVYAVLPAEYTEGAVQIDLGGETITVDPDGAQTFMVDVSRVSTTSRTEGFARVYRE